MSSEDSALGPPARFDYMEWAKQNHSREGYRLCLSSVPHRQWKDVVPRYVLRRDLFHVDSGLEEWLAERYSVPASRVAVVAGTSGGNYYALASLLRPGSRVLVESPTYAVFDKIARFHGAAVDWLERRPEDGFQVDVEAVARAWRPGTRALVLTNANNPTGAPLDAATRDALHDFVRERDAWLLLDEVYQEYLDPARFQPGSRAVGADPDSRVIVTNSLTKVYGLGDLRIGWIIAAEPLLHAARGVEDLVSVVVPNALKVVVAAVLPRLDELRAETRPMLEQGWQLLEDWAATEPRVRFHDPGRGARSAFVWVELEGVEDTHRFAVRLRDELDTLINPGEFFGRPGWVRLGLGIPRDELASGLERISSLLSSAA